MSNDNHCNSDTDARLLVRVPGLFRRWEIADVLEPGVDFRFERAAESPDGTALYAVYRAERVDAAVLPPASRRD